MKTHTQSLLRALESSEKITVLYANQSGKRAWDLATAEDVWEGQFIYIRPEESYLEIEEAPSGSLSIQEESLRLLGRDVRSFLAAYLASDISVLEALHSPEVYLQSRYFPATLWALLPEYFSPAEVIRQYVAQSKERQGKRKTKTVSVQAYLEALRPMLAATWVAARKNMPPLSLPALAEPLIGHPSLLAEIKQLYLLLHASGPKAKTHRPPAIEQYLQSEAKRLGEVMKALPIVQGSPQKLTEFFRYLLTLSPA